MWFKNLSVYRLTKSFNETQESLNEKLQTFEFSPCLSQQTHSMGWIAPLNTPQKGDHSAPLVHASNHYLMLCMKRQDKILPASVINEQLEEKRTQIEEQEQRKLTKKERDALKEDIQFDLLPRAFVKSSKLYTYIDSKSGLLFINSSSDNKCEELINAIREALGSFAVIPLAAKNTPISIMTQWIEEANLPATFMIGTECELKNFQDEASIRCKNQDLLTHEIQSHIQAGLSVKQIAICWQEKLEFIVDDKLCLKRIKCTDALLEQADDAEDAIAQFDADFAMMSQEFNQLIDDLMLIFGGFSEFNQQLVDEKIAAALKED